MASLLPTPEPPDPVEGALGHFDHTNWVKASLKALDAGTVHVANGVAGALAVDSILVDDSKSVDALIKLRGSGQRGILSDNAAGNPRWRMFLGDTTAETGSDSGSKFLLQSFSDAGVARSVLAADRVNGLLSVAADPTVALGVATKQYVDATLPLGAIIGYGGALPLTGRMAQEWHPCDGTAHNSSALATLLGSAVTPDMAGLFVVGAGQNKDVATGATTNYARGTGTKSGKESVVLTQAQTPVQSHTHSINHTHSAGTSGAGTPHNHTINHDHGSITSGGGGTHRHNGYSANWYGSSMDQNPAGTDYSPIGQGPGHPDPPAEISTVGNHTHTVDLPTYSGVSGTEGAHTHSVSVPAYTGTSGAGADATATEHENRPPYYALVYIIKKV